MSILQNRYDFIWLFDVCNGNPNGDPDADNLPRLDPETGLGLVSDVCLKRKIRNYVDLVKDDEGDNYLDPQKEQARQGYKIYVREKAILNEQQKKAYKYYGLTPDKNLSKEKDVTLWMCANFFDIRAFGAVMTTGVNCGQVRGPVQLTFGRSQEAITPLEISITRMAVTRIEDAEKQSGDNRTMGRKHVVPYALYQAQGFVSAPLARKTGFSEQDLQLLWDAILQAFEHDRSAARGLMATRKLIIFQHEDMLGRCPAYKLFDLVKVTRRKESGVEPARSFDDYRVEVGQPPAGVSLEIKE
ncbi:MAG: type I-C CRISPR-associated protein Cas7/Csd2 [Desulfarculales bacterium]|jgi:CRISPR-associated protein Csd2|nr:type I-C CRISPR-associated protein Cas7/Csd2 [Desulfarculales bacterium]